MWTQDTIHTVANIQIPDIERDAIETPQSSIAPHSRRSELLNKDRTGSFNININITLNIAAGLMMML